MRTIMTSDQERRNSNRTRTHETRRVSNFEFRSGSSLSPDVRLGSGLASARLRDGTRLGKAV